MSQSQNAETGESAANPTRRKFIKGVTIGSGVAATGGLSTQTRFSPVGTSEAVLPAGAILAGGLIAGGVGRYAYEKYMNDPTDGEDITNLSETQAYSQALSNANAFEQRRENIDKENRVKRFEDSLWSEVRAAGVRAFENDENAQTAFDNAVTEMEKVLNNRLVNIIRASNAEIGSGYNLIKQQIDGEIGNVEDGGNRGLNDEPFDGSFSDFVAQPDSFSTLVEDLTGAWVAEISGALKNDETIEFYFTTAGDIHFSVFGEFGSNYSDGDAGELTSESFRYDVSDPDSDESVDLIVSEPYTNAITQTFDTFDQVKSDAETYLNNLETEYEKGTVDASSVLTGRELMEEQGYVDESGELTEEYEGATDEERLAAESTASGMGAPDDAGVRARITHASLSGEQTGNLFIDFTGDGGSLSVGEIPASDYNYAIFGATYDDGSFGIETLESETEDGTAQPIEVLEVIGAQERDFSYTDEEITVGSNGDVVVYEGTDPPEELANPSNYSGYQVDIETADSTATVDISDITESGSQYIASTSLSEGTTVENIVFRAPVNYEEISGYEPGDTTVDLERLKEQEETIKNQQEQIEKLQNQGGGGGGFLPDVSIDSNSTIIAVVAVILVAFGLLGNN